MAAEHDHDHDHDHEEKPKLALRPDENGEYPAEVKECTLDDEALSCVGSHCPSETEMDDHGHHHHKIREKKTLLISMIITGVVMVAEMVGGVITNSLALLSDGGHMLTHLTALGISYVAIVLAARGTGKERTFGMYRVEIVSAMFNGFFILLVTVFILSEAYERIQNPEDILVGEMLVVALLGLVVNLIVAFLLSRTDHENDLNIQGAFIHMLTDTLSSVGVIVGGIVIHYTGWTVIDPILSVFIAVVILYWVWNLFRDALSILMEFSPSNIDSQELKRVVVAEVEDVINMHDLHVWSITAGMVMLTAHLVVKECSVHDQGEILKQVTKLLEERFKVNHTTLQIECECVLHA